MSIIPSNFYGTDKEISELINKVEPILTDDQWGEIKVIKYCDLPSNIFYMAEFPQKFAHYLIEKKTLALFAPANVILEIYNDGFVSIRLVGVTGAHDTSIGYLVKYQSNCSKIIMNILRKYNYYNMDRS